MKMDGKNALAGLLLLTLIISTSTVSSQTCCDFSPSSICTWNTVNFLTSPTNGYPNTATYYPNFYTTLPDTYYTYLQDSSGTTTSLNGFFVSDTTTTFRWDYYYNSPSAGPDSYLHVFAHNGAINTLIGSFTLPQDKWHSITVVCDSTVAYCCGNLASVPCSVTLEIVASLGSSGTTGLFAIGNIGTCSDVQTTTATTTTIRPTLPPPHPPTTDCCDFNTDVCGMSGSNWFWSAYSSPPLQVPPTDLYYLWTDIKGATLYTYAISDVEDDTTFAVDYYTSSTDVSLSFYFLPASGGSSDLLGTLSSDTGNWVSTTQTCSGCCFPNPSPCDGQIKVQVNSVSSPFVAAIDNAGVNSACAVDTLPCCYFDDSDACRFANPGYGSYFWQWSGTIPPFNSIPSPTPDSEYEYFEITSSNASPLNVVLQSPLISIDSTQEFMGNFFVRTTGANQLQLNFREQTTGQITTMDFVTDTTNLWRPLTLQCSSGHGQCCQSLSECSGYVEITAIVEALSAPLVFAIDSFQVGTTCNPFPGARNSTLLHFGHPSTK